MFANKIKSNKIKYTHTSKATHSHKFPLVFCNRPICWCVYKCLPVVRYPFAQYWSSWHCAHLPKWRPSAGPPPAALVKYLRQSADCALSFIYIFTSVLFCGCKCVCAGAKTSSAVLSYNSYLLCIFDNSWHSFVVGKLQLY